MSTNKENTLEVKDFKGISRYLSSPNQDPDKWNTQQNMWSPTRGEMGIIPGVAEAAISIPGVESILYMAPLQQSWGDKGWVIGYKPSYSTLALPTGSVFTTLGGGATSRKVSIEFVNPGGINQPCFTTPAAKNFGASGLRVTVPTNVPSYIHAINFWVETGAATDKYIWAGSMSRKNGSFAASIDIFLPGAILAAGDKDCEDTPTGFTIVPATGGNLASDRQYYFAICPWIPFGDGTSTRFTVSLADSSNRFFAVTLPPGYSAFTIKFSGMAGTAGASGTGYNFSQMFMGQTPEDLLPASISSDGIAIPISFPVISGVGTTITDLPYNSDQAPNMQLIDTTDNSYTGRAHLRRSIGAWQAQNNLLSALAGSAPVNINLYMGLALIQAPYAASTHRELLGKPFGGPRITDLGANGLPNINGYVTSFVAYPPTDSRQFMNRRYIVDGMNSLFYTNGIILSAAVRDSYNSGTVMVPISTATQYIPICNRIEIFQDLFVLTGGANNFSNTRGAVYYSSIPGSGAGVLYTFGTTDWNYLTVNYGDESDIVGMGVYSRDLSNTGPGSFLLVGKATTSFSWNGGKTGGDTQLREIGKDNGWVSKNCYTLTKEGAILVTRNNVYLVNGSDFVPIGDDVQSIIQGISEANLPYTMATYTRDRLIIGYRTTANVDTEVWCDFRHNPDGNTEFIWTGPHVMKSYDGVATVPSYAGIRDYRMSYLGAKLYRRDIVGTYTNDTADIPIVLETHDMALGSDPFWKVLTRLYLRAKINRQETISVSIKMQDSQNAGSGLDVSTSGQQTFSETFVLPYTGVSEIYRLFQKVWASRYRGSIVRITMSLSTNVDFRINLMSVLFNKQNRRLL